FTGATAVQNSVLICNGTVGSIQTVRDSIVVSTEKVGAVTVARNSYFQAPVLGGQQNASGNFYVNLKQVDGADPETNRFVESKDDILSMLKWFDPAAAGLKLTHA